MQGWFAECHVRDCVLQHTLHEWWHYATRCLHTYATAKKIDHTYARQSCGAELCFVSHSGDDSFIIFPARAQTHSGRYGTRTR